MQWPFYPRTGIGVSGYAWLDNSYEKINVGTIPGPGYTKEYLQQGRFLLRVTPTYSNDIWFVQAQAEFVANKDQTQTQPATGIADTDDLWVRAGQWNKWDVMVGRFEGFEVYHLGMGLDLNTEERRGRVRSAAARRRISTARASSSIARPASGNVALPPLPDRPLLRFELLTQFGSTRRPQRDRRAAGARLRHRLVQAQGRGRVPVAQGAQPGRSDGEAGTAGVGGDRAVRASAGIEFGAQHRLRDHRHFRPERNVPTTNNSGNTTQRRRLPNARLIEGLLVGLGANYVTFENLHLNTRTARNDKSTNLQTFVAAAVPDRQQLFVKLVGAYAKSHFEQELHATTAYDDTMTSVRAARDVPVLIRAPSSTEPIRRAVSDDLGAARSNRLAD